MSLSELLSSRRSHSEFSIIAYYELGQLFSRHTKTRRRDFTSDYGGSENNILRIQRGIT